MDNETERLGIDNYTLECTSLEQIFLDMERDAAQGAESQKLLEKIGMKKIDKLPIKDLDTRSEASSQLSEATVSSAQSTLLIRNELLTGSSLFWSQFGGLIKKRYLHSIRDWRYFLTIVVLPSVLLAVSLGIGLMKPTNDNPPLLMTPSIYGPKSNSFIQ